MKASVWMFLVSLAAAGPVSAGMISHSDSISMQPTDWALSLSVPQFNPALGSLDAVEFQFHGDMNGTIFYENEEPAPADVNLLLSASLTLQRPDLTTLISLAPSHSIMETAPAFDGLLDFSGASGRTYPGIAASDSDSYVTLPMEDLSPYIGLGNVALPCSALGNSSGSGPGNWTFGFLTNAAADVTVTYHYTPIPEPATFAMASLGCWLGARTRRRFS